MPFSHLRLSGPSQAIIRLPNTPLSPLVYHMVFCSQFQPTSRQSTYQLSIVNNKCPSVCNINSCTRKQTSRALGIVDAEETCDFEEWWKLSVSIVQTELQRRRKIGFANKGRVPWNKGRKHSAETRERISQRTKEAMIDPKVRKKMSECPRAHSDQTKAKIRSSVQQLWGERLKWKSEKIFLSWADSIAEAAKKGGSGQQELHWDSYDKIKEEIDLHQHQWAANRVKAKLRAAQAKTEKMIRLAEKREQEQKAKAKAKARARARERARRKRKRNRKTRRKPEARKELVNAQALTLEERLKMILKMKSSTNCQITCEDQRSSKKLDLEMIKAERSLKGVSLADQIRAAKAKRVVILARE